MKINKKRLLAAVEEYSEIIARKLNETCSDCVTGCEDCIWFDESIDIGCVWRVRDDVPPCDWEG